MFSEQACVSWPVPCPTVYLAPLQTFLVRGECAQQLSFRKSKTETQHIGIRLAGDCVYLSCQFCAGPVAVHASIVCVVRSVSSVTNRRGLKCEKATPLDISGPFQKMHCYKT